MIGLSSGSVNRPDRRARDMSSDVDKNKNIISTIITDFECLFAKKRRYTRQFTRLPTELNIIFLCVQCHTLRFVNKKKVMANSPFPRWKCLGRNPLHTLSTMGEVSSFAVYQRPRFSNPKNQLFKNKFCALWNAKSDTSVKTAIVHPGGSSNRILATMNIPQW